MLATRVGDYTAPPDAYERTGHLGGGLRLPSHGRAAAVGFAVATGLLAPGTGSAQWEIGPRIGMYVPLGPLIEEGSLGSAGGYSRKNLGVTLMLGVDAAFRATQRLSVAASVMFGPSPTAVTDSTGTSDHSSSVLLTAVRLIEQVTPASKGLWSMYLGAGAGTVSRGGAPWQYYSGVTNPAIVASLGVGTPLYGLGVQKPYPPPHVVMRAEVVDYISHAQFDKGLVTQTTARWHNDVTLSVLFSLRLRNR